MDLAAAAAGSALIVFPLGGLGRLFVAPPALACASDSPLGRRWEREQWAAREREAAAVTLASKDKLS
jgi:hypothetical protein